MTPDGGASLTRTATHTMSLPSHAVTCRASAHRHPMAAMRSTIVNAVTGAIALDVHLFAQRCSFGCALRVKVRNLADTHGAVTGPLTKIHIVKGGPVEDAAIVPDCYSVLVVCIFL